jgi:hypothetical protein
LDALQQRDAERERLAGAGTGLADDVVAAERDGQRQRLDGKGFDDALGFECIGYLGDDPELMKRSQGFQPPWCGVDLPDRGAAKARRGAIAPRRPGFEAARSRGRDQPWFIVWV